MSAGFQMLKDLEFEKRVLSRIYEKMLASLPDSICFSLKACQSRQMTINVFFGKHAFV